MSSKLAEAEDFIKKAERSLKTSIFKWKPDVDSAIDFYGKAALIYRNLKMLRESAELYCLVAKLNFENGSYFHCGKAYDTASLLYRDASDYEKMVKCVETAGYLLRQAGVPDTATSIYEKAAKALETHSSEKSAEFYRCAADASELEEKYLQASSLAGQSARMWTSVQRFSHAQCLLRYQMKLCELASANEPQTAYQVCGKAIVALVIIKLFQGDPIAASKVFNNAVEQYHFSETDDAGPVSRLLKAYETMDADEAMCVIKMPTFRTLETEFARLARSIKFPSSDILKADMQMGESPAGVEETIDLC